MFLKMCSDADMSIDSRECMSSIDDHTQLYVSENLIPMSMIKKRSRLENLRLNDEVNSCKQLSFRLQGIYGSRVYVFERF